MYQVNDKLKTRVNEMFGKTEETALEDVESIKKWLETQPHLPEIMSDVKIKNMLNLSKFNLKKTKKQIDSYYTVRTKYSDIFKNSNPKLPNMKKAMEDNNICNHPDLLDDLYRVLFIRLKAENTLIAKDLFMLYFAILEIRLQEDFMGNDVVIVDMENYSFQDIVTLSLPLLIKMINVHKNVYSLRVMKTYMINTPAYVSLFMKILKYVLPTKVYKRISVYKDAEILKDVFSKDALPKDYGGNGPSLNDLDEMMKKKYDESQDRFDLLDTLRINENLRPKCNN